MDNLKIYEAVREVPATAQKTIRGGRLNGKTDINPMWRIKALTEQFGPCGVGWYIEKLAQWTETSANGEVAAFCNINLYVKSDCEWSKPIFGTGGSMFVANEKSGPYTSDECYKMAYTDAISVCCKALGFGADIYWDADRTKYDKDLESEKQEKPKVDHSVYDLPPSKLEEMKVDMLSLYTEDQWNAACLRKYKKLFRDLLPEEIKAAYGEMKRA